MSTQEMTPTGRLENWTYDKRGVMWGNLYDDKRHRWHEGAYVHTSELLTQGPYKEGMHVETVNSIYLLGRPLATTI